MRVPRLHDPTGLRQGRSYAQTLRAWRELSLLLLFLRLPERGYAGALVGGAKDAENDDARSRTLAAWALRSCVLPAIQHASPRTLLAGIERPLATEL